MSREWKPGDVAMVEVRGRQYRATFYDTGSERGWWHGRGTVMDQYLAVETDADPRPLVVIDPEDREQCRDLAERIAPNTSGNTNAVQAALREFANPTPPRPDEPQGLAAVVEDAEGREWIRRVRKGRSPWAHYDETERTSRARDYAEIDAVRVLSPGVTP